MSITELYSIYLKHPTVCTDTRKIISESIFFALKGENFNGNSFAHQALKAGASYAVIDEPDYKVNEKCILVNDVLTTLQQLALYHRKQLDIPCIGLTGSNGKTTTKELINSVLSQKYKTYATIGNLNNHIGVPLTILSITNTTEIAIIEMGANHQKEIEMLCEICLPNYGLITNVGKAHLEGFGGFEGVKKGKGELYHFLQKNHQTLFINTDNTHLVEMKGEKIFSKIITYGTSKENFVSGKLIANNPFLCVEWESENTKSKVQSALTGAYNFENILAAVAVGLTFGLHPKEINKGIESYLPQNHRSQIIKTKNNTLIGDYYNANPTSMIAAINNLAQLQENNKVLILGDMFELGCEAEKEHLSVFKEAYDKQFKLCVFVGKEFYKLKAYGNKQILFFNTTTDALEYFKNATLKDNFILLKGSRSMKLETLLEVL